MDHTPNLSLPYIIAAQAQKHVTHNEAIRALDALVHLAVVTRQLASPPVSAADGARYIVASSATGAWAGHTNDIAAYQDGGWYFYQPAEGMLTWVADEDQLRAFTGTAWAAAFSVGTLPSLGVNATADTSNRLAVASAGTLFTHDGSGHQVKINKASNSATGSVLFQTGFSGRAEFGLAGDDDLHLKVSADGTTWRDALIVDRITGRVQFPSGGTVTARDTGVVLQVPSQYGTIQQALDAMLGFRFTGTGQGVIELAAGTYALTSALRTAHPQPSRIVIRGPAAVSPLAETDIASTRIATETTVRARYAAILECRSTTGLVLGSGEGVTLQDIALVQAGTGAFAGIDLVGTAGVQLTRSTLVGFAFGIAARHGARVVLDQGSCLVHADQHGATLDTASSLRTTGATSLLMRSGQYGLRASGNSTVDLAQTRIKGNGAGGLLIEAQSAAVLAGCDVRDNAANGIQLTHHSTATLQASTLAPNAAKAVSAAYGSTVSVNGITVGGTPAQATISATAASLIVSSGVHTGTPVFDPAVGTTANNGSWSV